MSRETDIAKEIYELQVKAGETSSYKEMKNIQDRIDALLEELAELRENNAS